MIKRYEQIYEDINKLSKEAVKRYNQIKKIIDEGQYGKVDDITVDVTTAGMLWQIIQKLDTKSQEKFLITPIEKMIDVGWKLVKG